MIERGWRPLSQKSGWLAAHTLSRENRSRRSPAPRFRPRVPVRDAGSKEVLG